MKLNEYQELSKRTMPGDGSMTEYDLTNYALGLVGEGGEVADEIKKVVFHGHELDRDKLEKELGDVFHYLAGMATLLDLSLEDVATANLAKLAERYPMGFSSEDSVKRVDTKKIGG